MGKFGDIIGNVIGQVLANRLISALIPEPGRYPRTEPAPILVPRGAELDTEQPGVYTRAQDAATGGFNIPFWAFMALYGAFMLWVLRPKHGGTAEEDFEACLQEAGWSMPKVDSLMQSIRQKPTNALTEVEHGLLQAFDACRRDIERRYRVQMEDPGAAPCGCDNQP